MDGPLHWRAARLVSKGDTNGFASESDCLLGRQRNMRLRGSRADCERCRFVGPAYRGTYSGSVANSMPQAELDECRSYMPVVDRTARRDASGNGRRNRERSKGDPRNFDNTMTSCVPLFCRLTWGFTRAGGIKRTAWPIVRVCATNSETRRRSRRTPKILGSF